MSTVFLKSYLASLLAVVLVIGAFSVPRPAAALTLELGGWAWSSTIGWISLNCVTGGSGGGDICGTSNYKVVVNDDETVTGYAWSSNVGWIRFGGLSGFPSASGNSAVNARVTGTYPNFVLQGWARACAGTDSGTNGCSSMSINGSSGNWDGWISLRGTNYQVNIDDFGTPQYVWGSTNVGWIDASSRALIDKIISDLRINSLALSGTPTNDAQGTVDNVRFSAAVVGFPLDYPAVDYRLRIPAASATLNGTYRNGTFSPALVFNNLPYGVDYTATLEIDLPAPGDLEENDPNTAANEETAGNTFTSAQFDLAADPPRIEFVSDRTDTDRDTVRSDEQVTMRWEVEALYDVTCRINGNVTGNRTITHVFASGAVSSGTITSASLSNKSSFELECDAVPTIGVPRTTATVVVDMIPSVQEI